MIRGITDPTLTIFRPVHPNGSGIAVVICPGGGYSGVVIDKEGYQVAQRLNEYGITAFVLKYRLPNGQPPAAHEDPLPMQDLRHAIRLVRSHAEEFKIDAHKVGVMGFSAGGHLAGIIATEADPERSSTTDQIDSASSRPDFAVLVYPVVSMRDPLAHVGSRENLLGKDSAQLLQARFSVDENVTRQTPPLFIVHAKDDAGVPVENSVHLREAAERMNVPCHLLLLEKGGHGFGLGVHGGEASQWIAECIPWMKQTVSASHR